MATKSETRQAGRSGSGRERMPRFRRRARFLDVLIVAARRLCGFARPAPAGAADKLALFSVPSACSGESKLLWRVVFSQGTKSLNNFSAGPWHPSKEHVERWAAWLRAYGQQAQVQSSAESGAMLRSG